MIGLTWSLWMTTISFLLGPYWFNPASFEWKIIVTDYISYNNWLSEPTGTPEGSWAAWFKEEILIYSKLSQSWKLLLLLQKCGLWMIISYGLFGQMKFFNDQTELLSLLEVIMGYILFGVGMYMCSCVLLIV